MNRLKAAILGFLLGGASLLIPAGAAYADEGDGDKLCDYTEICFRYGPASGFSINGDYMHTFYNSNWHHENEYLWGPADHCCPVVMDNANGFWNRDSSCRVQLWDITNGNWYVYADLPIGYRGDAAYKINNAHTRCG